MSVVQIETVSKYLKRTVISIKSKKGIPRRVVVKKRDWIQPNLKKQIEHTDKQQ